MGTGIGVGAQRERRRRRRREGCGASKAAKGKVAVTASVLPEPRYISSSSRRWLSKRQAHCFLLRATVSHHGG